MMEPNTAAAGVGGDLAGRSEQRTSEVAAGLDPGPLGQWGRMQDPNVPVIRMVPLGL
jgi:hypothetical protein